MLLFLYGPDTYRSRAHLKKMVSKFKIDRDPQGLNVVKIDAEKEKIPGNIMEQILATPFLAERRMVVVESLLVSKHKELMDELSKRVAENSLPESNVIVFWEGTDKFKTKAAKAFFEILRNEKFAQSFEQQKGVKLGGWISSEVKERGGAIIGPAVQFLANNVGSDMWRLSSLVDQLVAYKGDSEIDVSAVQLFLNEKVDDSIFNLVDAIVGKQERKVFKMIQEQYNQL